MASGSQDTAGARRPIDLLLGGWSLVAATALLFPHRPSSWPVFALLHLLFAAATLRLPPVSAWTRAYTRRYPGVADFIREWFPLLLLPVLYLELGPLNRAVFGGNYFDDIILRWEETLFGGQPSHDWARAMSSLVLSELLHTAYVAYYFAIYVPAIVVWVARPRSDFRILMFSIMATFVVHYGFFVFFPVQGPRYVFPAPEGGIENGLVYRLTHFVLETGSSQGAAFPSSHVGATAAIAFAVRRMNRNYGLALGFLALGVAVGAVYGGFHYGLDVVAGGLLGCGIGVLAPRIYRLLERSGARRGEGP